MSNSNKEQLVTDAQEIQEEHITVSFVFPKTQRTPQTGTLILRQFGFGVVAIIKVSPNEAQTKDIVVELIHNRLCTRAHVWVKMQDGVGGWVLSARFQRQYHFTSYLV
jgi:hypothetical protein